MRKKIWHFVRKQSKLLEGLREEIGADDARCEYNELCKVSALNDDGTVLCAENVEKLIPNSLMIFDKNIKKSRIEVQWVLSFDDLSECDFNAIFKQVRRAAKTDVRFDKELVHRGILVFSFRKNPEKILEFNMH